MIYHRVRRSTLLRMNKTDLLAICKQVFFFINNAYMIYRSLMAKCLAVAVVIYWKLW